jgi:hypothetical protein
MSANVFLTLHVEVVEADLIREIRLIRLDPNSIRSDFLEKSN